MANTPFQAHFELIAMFSSPCHIAQHAWPSLLHALDGHLVALELREAHPGRRVTLLRLLTTPRTALRPTAAAARSRGGALHGPRERAKVRAVEGR